MSKVIERATETLKIEAESILQLIPRLGQKFEDAVQAVLKCEGKVILTGIGKSGQIARKMASTLSSTGTPAVYLHPAESSHGDLGMISKTDLVIAISESDRALLARENSGLRITVIPLIYSIPPLRPKPAKPIRDILFVADFAHDANVDGIAHFCRQVLPLVVAQFPDARLRIVGGSPPREVQELAGPSVEVLGYVQDIQPLYTTSDIAIAPMRFGGGLKGKIAEAMAFGLPVVTNTACLEGFGLTPSDNVMVGDTPIEMAGAVARLFAYPALYDKIRTTGWEFVRENYSEQMIAEKVNEMLGQLDRHPRKRLSASKRLRRNLRVFMERHLLWRLKTGPNKMRGKI